MRICLLLLLLLPACVSAQPASGPISGETPVASCAAGDFLWLEEVASGDTKSLTCAALAASAALADAYVDEVGDLMTGALEIEIADSGSAAPAGFDELLLDCGNVACGATIYGAAIAGRVGWNLGHPGFDSTGAWWSYNPTSSLMEIGTSTTGGAVQVYSGNGTQALTIDASQNVAVTGDLTVDTPTFHVESSTGRVGILDLTPDFPLDVEGDGFFRGDLTLQDDSGGGSLAFTMANTAGATPSTWSISTLASSGNWRVRDDTNYNAFQIEEGLSGSAFWYGDAGGPGWGLGTTVPDGLLHVFAGSAGSVTANVAADDFVVECSGDCGISVLNPNGSSGSLVFGSPADDDGAELIYSQAGGVLYINVQGGSSDQIEIIVGANTWRLYGGGAWDVPCVASAPFTCGGATAGRSYCDSTTQAKICFCDGSNFFDQSSLLHLGDCT